MIQILCRTDDTVWFRDRVSATIVKAEKQIHQMSYIQTALIHLLQAKQDCIKANMLVLMNTKITASEGRGLYSNYVLNA